MQQSTICLTLCLLTVVLCTIRKTKYVTHIHWIHSSYHGLICSHIEFGNVLECRSLKHYDEWRILFSEAVGELRHVAHFILQHSQWTVLCVALSLSLNHFNIMKLCTFAMRLEIFQMHWTYKSTFQDKKSIIHPALSFSGACRTFTTALQKS